MEAWELIKRLLAGSTGPARSLGAEGIATLYFKELKGAGHEINQTLPDIQKAADFFATQLQDAGLIRPAGVRGGGLAILGAMERTEFGEELYVALSGHNVLSVFEGMNVEINAGEIRRVLHQLNS